jgi:hypothetical protein
VNRVYKITVAIQKRDAKQKSKASDIERDVPTVLPGGAKKGKIRSFQTGTT